MTTTLKTDGGDKSLDFGTKHDAFNQKLKKKIFGPRNSRLEVGSRIGLLLTLDFSPHDVFSNVIVLAQIEEPSDLGRPLGTQPLWQDDIR